MGDVLGRLKGHALYPIVGVALATGMRRGEILALRWTDVNLDGAELHVERSLEETKAGLKFKAPKTRHGRRWISLPASVVEALKAHRKAQLETRLAIGLGKLEPHSLVFCNADGPPCRPTT
jgi:integrase